VVVFLRFNIYIQNNLVNATELPAFLPPLMHRRYIAENFYLGGNMKKIIFIFPLILFLASCDSSVESNNSVSSNGFIKKIETSTWQYGTHTLNNLQGKPRYALKSLNYNLDDFNNKKVIIRGIKIEGYPVDGGPIYVDVKSIEEIQ